LVAIVELLVGVAKLVAVVGLVATVAGINLLLLYLQLLFLGY